MREKGLKVEKEINHIVSTNLFVTITNANFDEKAINRRINITLNAIRDLQNSLHLPLDKDVEEYIDADIPKRLGKAMSIGVLQTQDPDKRSLKELIIYGLKGLCAYVKHANALGYEDEEVDAFIQKTLSVLIDEHLSVDELVSLTLKTGEAGVKGMALLDSANTGSYGNRCSK